MSLDRRNLMFASLGGVVATGLAFRGALAQAPGMAPVNPDAHHYGTGPRVEPYSRDEIIHAASDFFGAAAETIAGVIDKTVRENGGLPTGYLAGEEGAVAVTVGLRYGKGELHMKGRKPEEVYWQGPSVGFDLGGNASRVFTLCYNLHSPKQIYRHYAGVDGSIYVVGGFGLNYERADDITLAPIRAGVGARAGASVGYTDYSRTRHILPF